MNFLLDLFDIWNTLLYLQNKRQKKNYMYLKLQLFLLYINIYLDNYNIYLYYYLFITYSYNQIYILPEKDGCMAWAIKQISNVSYVSVWNKNLDIFPWTISSFLSRIALLESLICKIIKNSLSYLIFVLGS